MSSDSSSTISLSGSNHRVRTYRWRYLQLIKDGLIWLTGNRTRTARASDSNRSVSDSGKVRPNASRANQNFNRKVLRFKQIRTRSHPGRGKSRSASRRAHSKGGAWNKRGGKALTKQGKAFTRQGRKRVKMRKLGFGKRQASARSKSQSRKRNQTYDMTKNAKGRVGRPRLRHSSPIRTKRSMKLGMTRRQLSDERDLKRRWTSSQDLLIPIRQKTTKHSKLQKRSGPSESLMSASSRYCLASTPVTPTVSRKGSGTMTKHKRGRPPTKGRRMATRSMSRLTRANSVPSGSGSTAVICVTKSRSSNSELYD